MAPLPQTEICCDATQRHRLCVETSDSCAVIFLPFTECTIKENKNIK